MAIHDHEPDVRGRAFLWGGIGAGALFLLLVLTHGLGLFGGSSGGAREAPLLVRRGSQILVPEGSALRARLTVIGAAAEVSSARITLPAVVEADPARTVAVLPAVAGRIAELKVALGERVSKGQVLAVIDSGDLALAFSEDDKAADAAKLTAKNLSREEEQNRIGAASDRELDQARSEHAQAVAEYARTATRLRVLGVTPANRTASRMLEVTAPMGGSITTLATAPGTMVNDPTQPLMSIADISTLWVTALVPEKDIASVSRNQDAEVTLDAYPGRVLHGKVLFIADVIEPDTRRNKIRIAFANADYTLKPNMFATVTLTGAPRSRIVLPSSALLMNNDRTSVFVATAPWTFERRIVEPELAEGTTVAIRTGLAAGEQVVVSGGILLND